VEVEALPPLADEVPEIEEEPVAAEAVAGPDDQRIAAMLAAVAAAPAAEPAARAERPMPTDAAPMTERSARTSLFGARRAAAQAPAPTPAAAPPARAVAGARPGEPVMRVRAPAPRPTEPARPAAPLPEELATPRLVPGSERRVEVEAADAGPRGERRERPRIAARVVAPPPQPVAAPVAPVMAVDRDVVDAAIGTLVARSVALAGEVDQTEKPPVDMILDHVRQTTEQVMEHLARATSPDLRRINGDLGEVLDLVMLMQLEKGHAPADDALTLLLQIRRDLETLRPV
jgi:hypothetical protein